MQNTVTLNLYAEILKPAIRLLRIFGIPKKPISVFQNLLYPFILMPMTSPKTSPLLSIQQLHAGIEEKSILKGINLEIKPGEVHAVMGPNGSGKSTLSSVLAGHPSYTVTEGAVQFNGKDLLEMDPEVRAREGLFLAFQYPVELPGVSMVNFMKTALQEQYRHRQQEPLNAKDFLAYQKQKQSETQLDSKIVGRSVNEGFSGGEKKRNEVYQMAMLQPKLAILDETDSGLDIDALKIVAQGVNALRSAERSFLVITHYQRLLDYIVPDVVHVLYNGVIVQSGDRNLALELETHGYDPIKLKHS